MKYDVNETTTLFDFLTTKTHKKRKDIKNLLKFKQVQVNGQIQTHYAYTLQPGDTVNIESSIETLPFPIVYEDKELIVIDKPCGLLTEKTQRESERTAYQIVKEYLLKKKESIYLVHRLDQYTSGLLMFVKNEKLYQALTHHWNEYVKVRGYIAIVEGHMKQNQGTIMNYLAESKTQQVYITSRDKGKKAITHYRVIKTQGNYTMVELRLDTGRKNQIRVHMASLKHPIIGDSKYGAKTNPIQRLALHAHEFMFIHPFTHREIRVTSKTPVSFDKLMTSSKKRLTRR